MPEIALDPAITALLLMDADTSANDETAKDPAWRRSLRVVEALLAAARQQGLLVVHARPLDGAREFPAPDPSGTSFGMAADASPYPDLPPPVLGEPVVDAADCPSLQRSQLERILVTGGIRTLVLAGRADALHLTHVLVPVLDGGYRCLLVRDACLPPECARGHSVLDTLSLEIDTGVLVVDSAEVLAALTRTKGIETSDPWQPRVP